MVIKGTEYYDAYNPRARELFYQFSKKAHFDIGVDALWLDATEPEGFPNKGRMLHLASGDALANPYSLETTRAISEGLRRDFPLRQGARVFSLTRSSFAAQQTHGALTILTRRSVPTAMIMVCVSASRLRSLGSLAEPFFSSSDFSTAAHSARASRPSVSAVRLLSSIRRPCARMVSCSCSYTLRGN